VDNSGVVLVVAALNGLMASGGRRWEEEEVECSLIRIGGHSCGHEMLWIHSFSSVTMIIYQLE